MRQTSTTSFLTTTIPTRISRPCAPTTTHRNPHARVRRQAITLSALNAHAVSALPNFIPSKSKGKVMKVRLLAPLGQNDIGTEMDVTKPEGEWLIYRGVGELVSTATDSRVAPAPAPELPAADAAPRRGPGRPRSARGAE